MISLILSHPSLSFSCLFIHPSHSAILSHPCVFSGILQYPTLWFFLSYTILFSCSITFIQTLYPLKILLHPIILKLPYPSVSFVLVWPAESYISPVHLYSMVSLSRNPAVSYSILLSFTYPTESFSVLRPGVTCCVLHFPCPSIFHSILSSLSGYILFHPVPLAVSYSKPAWCILPYPTLSFIYFADAYCALWKNLLHPIPS